MKSSELFLMIEVTNKILLIDDDVALCELLAEYLVSEGFAVENQGAHAVESCEFGG
jgi:DNA-binding response OmpR family regulator